MKDIPILMNAAMVLAVLEGRKTQTRRIMNPQPAYKTTSVDWNSSWNAFWPTSNLCDSGGHGFYRTGRPVKCPYGEPGDRLWVRESARVLEVRGGSREITVEYQADKTVAGVKYPSRLAPAPLGKLLANGTYREASRITLEVVAVRVERLNNISAADAIKEGVQFFYTDDGEDTYYAVERNKTPCAETPEEVFAMLWDSIYGSWDTDPWVWVIEFKKI